MVSWQPVVIHLIQYSLLYWLSLDYIHWSVRVALLDKLISHCLLPFVSWRQWSWQLGKRCWASRISKWYFIALWWHVASESYCGRFSIVGWWIVGPKHLIAIMPYLRNFACFTIGILTTKTFNFTEQPYSKCSTSSSHYLSQLRGSTMRCEVWSFWYELKR